MKVFVTRAIPPIGIETLQAAGAHITVSPHDRPLSPAELLAGSEGCDGLISMLTDRIDATFLAARPTIRAVANFAVGYNNIDVAVCSSRKIGVGNTPEVLTDATAETAWMLLMMAARRAGEAERLLRAGRWNGWGPLQFIGVDVAGRTLGVIGAGRIGTRLTKMAMGFGMRVLYHNRKASTEMESLGSQLVSLDELLMRADFVSIHIPLTEQTRHLISTREFHLMKQTAVLINTARGPVVDEAALVETMRAKRIFAAGLDVYENEPAIHPGLLELDNVVLLPHIGSATESTRNRMAQLAAENLLAMLAGKRPPAPVNPELWP